MIVNVLKILIIFALGAGITFAHIPQPESSGELSKAQIKEISKVVGKLHKEGASHEKLHEAIKSLYKKWGIKYKKLKLK